jgi:hypothetical protein
MRRGKSFGFGVAGSEVRCPIDGVLKADAFARAVLQAGVSMPVVAAERIDDLSLPQYLLSICE